MYYVFILLKIGCIDLNKFNTNKSCTENIDIDVIQSINLITKKYFIIEKIEIRVTFTFFLHFLNKTCNFYFLQLLIQCFCHN